MEDKAAKEWKDNLWRYENVGAIIVGELVCLDCLTEDEKGRAEEDATADCKDIYIDSTELDYGSGRCERCRKKLVSDKKRLEMIKKGRW